MGEEKTKIGRYEILDKLGQGAMGIVYKARDPLIGRIVALKTITHSSNLPEEQKKEYAQRFFREAQAAGSLQHPNIVTTYDMGDDDGTPFIAMEYVEGKSLGKLIEEKGKIDWVEAIPIIKQVAEGLAFAHEKGIVHRDIKPDNILIDKNNRAVVTDFGIAHLEESSLTRTGEVLGTPFFMSPEQILEGRLDRRSDLFSLGVVFYLMLTGKRPFRGETISSICYHIVHTPPDTLPADDSIPSQLLTILSKILEKDPDKRYADGKTFVADLDQALGTLTLQGDARTLGSVSQTAPPPPPSPPRKAQAPKPPVPPAAKPLPEKKKSSALPIIIVGGFVLIIFVIIAAAGGFFVLKKIQAGKAEKARIQLTEEQEKLDMAEVTPQEEPKGPPQKEPEAVKVVTPVEKPKKREEKPRQEGSKTTQPVTPPPPPTKPPVTETKPVPKPGKIGMIFETRISEISLAFYIDGEEKVREVFTNEDGTRYSQELKLQPGQHQIRIVVQATKFPPFIRERTLTIDVQEGSHQIIKIIPARKPTPRLVVKKIDVLTGKSTVIMEK